MAGAFAQAGADDERLLEIILKARDGGHAAVNELVTVIRPIVCAMIAPVLANEVRPKEDRSDVAQDCLTAVWKNIGQFRGVTLAEFRAWLAGIVHNESRNKHRYWHQQRRDVNKEQLLPGNSAVGSPPFDQAPSPSQEASGKEQVDRLRKALTQLSGDHELVLRLHDIERLDWPKVAERMGRSVAAVKQLRHRALKELKDKMGAGHEPPTRSD